MADEQMIPLSVLRSYSPHPDKLDLTGLTQEEITHGIKSSKLPDYIRYKQYLTDTNEALAQLAEMIIQFAVNLGLDPDQTLDWARKLQQAVPQSEFDSWIATLLDGGPSIFMNTLSELQAKYPNGAAGVALVRETDPAKIYVWNGSTWEDFGDYQGIEIKDKSITEQKIKDEAVTPIHLQETYIPINKKAKVYDRVSGDLNLYIPKDTIGQKGILNIYGKFSSGTVVFYLLENLGTHFKVKERVTKVVTDGWQSVITNFVTSGNGREYIAILGSVYYSASGGVGFWEVANADKNASNFIGANTSSVHDFSTFPIYSDTKLVENFNNEINVVNSKLNNLSDDITIKRFGIYGDKTLEDYTTLSSFKKHYINNEVLESGNVVVSIKVPTQVGKVYILEKNGLNFTVLKAKDVEFIDGINVIDMEYTASGSGNEYVGYWARAYYTITSGNGFYESTSTDYALSYDSGQTFATADQTSLKADLAVEITYTTGLKTEVKRVSDKVDNIDQIAGNTLISLTDFKTPKYTEISDKIGFIGRWFDKTVDGVDCKATINSGSEFYFKVKNTTTINVNFILNSALATPYFAYSIDGSEMTRQLITSPTLPTVTTDEHIIRIVIDGLTESEDKWIGEKGIAFKDVTVDAGGLVAGILPKNRVIMFYGDSITEGVRALNMNNNSNGNSSTGAFPFTTSENLNAISYRVGFGALGITKNGSGGIPEMIDMIDMMTSARPTPYYEPDILVVNMGTNDGSATSEAFTTKFNAVLDRLTIKYSGTPIFVMIPFRKNKETEVRACVTGRSNMYLVETDGWDITTTDGTHPDVQGAKIAGEKLANEIIKILGKNYFL